MVIEDGFQKIQRNSRTFGTSGRRKNKKEKKILKPGFHYFVRHMGGTFSKLSWKAEKKEELITVHSSTKEISCWLPQLLFPEQASLHVLPLEASVPGLSFFSSQSWIKNNSITNKTMLFLPEAYNTKILHKTEFILQLKDKRRLEH